MRKQRKQISVRQKKGQPLWKMLAYTYRDVFVICLIIGGVFTGIILIFQLGRFGEYFVLVPWGMALFLLFLVGLPVIKCIYRLRRQERVLHLRFCDREDGGLPEEQQDWFWAHARGDVVLLHRRYVEKVTRIFVEKEGVLANEGAFYIVQFVDCTGKKHKIRLEHLKSERDRFTAWQKGPSVETEEDEDDIYLDDENAEA